MAIRDRLTRVGGRLNALMFGILVAATGLLPPRVRYGYVHRITRVLFRKPVPVLPALEINAQAFSPSSGQSVRKADLTCALCTSNIEVGGIGSVVELLAIALPAQGVTPVVVCVGDGVRAQRIRLTGIEVRSVEDEESARRVLEEIHPDVIQLHAPPEFLVAAACASGIPLVPVLHNTEIHFSRARWRTLAKLLERASCAIAVSASVRAFHAAHLPSRLSERILVAPNATSHHQAPTADQRRAARILLEHTVGTQFGGDVVFACLARYDAQKNIAGTVASFLNGLGEDGSERLVIAGQPSDWAEFRRADAIRRSSPNGDRVHLLAASDGWTLLTAADAFLLNSFFEGWPVAATEAWAAGLPLVLSDVGGARELVARDPNRSVLISNPCSESVTDSRVERARWRSSKQRNSAELADAVHIVAQSVDHARDAALAVPDIAISLADMVEAHAAVLRTAAATTVDDALAPRAGHPQNDGRGAGD